MAQFDVCRYRGTRAGTRYVVDVQSGLLDELGTRLVIPLYPLTANAQPITRLNPMLEIEGKRHLLATQEMAAINKKLLGEAVQSALQQRDSIIAAIDLLITGI